MYRHVVMLKWTKETTPEQHSQAAAGMRALEAKISVVRHYELGENVSADPSNFDVVALIDFERAEDYLVYLDHPEHRQLIAKITGAITAERVAVQYELG